MKVYADKTLPPVPERTVEELTGRKCDLCGKQGKDKWEHGIYEVAETEVKVEVREKSGDSYPDGGWGHAYDIDLCPACFKNKLVPWLRTQGAEIQETEWEW